MNIPDSFALHAFRKHLPHLEMELVEIPTYMHAGIIRYLLWGIPPGGFLRSVICNDFMGIVGRADGTNINHLRDYANLMSIIPGGCVGSVEKYDNWVKLNGLLGRCSCGVINGGVEPHKLDCLNEVDYGT